MTSLLSESALILGLLAIIVALSMHSLIWGRLSFVQAHQARDVLQRQTDILRSVLDSMTDGVLVADARGHILLFNQAAEHVLGMKPSTGHIGDVAARYGFFLPDGHTPYPPERLPLARALHGEVVGETEMVL